MGQGRVVAITAVVLVAACTSSSSAAAWHEVAADQLATGTVRLVQIAGAPSGLIGVGSVTTDDNRVPALWRTTDGIAWQRLTTAPKSPYGFVSELTTVAATADGRAAAIGQAVGGTHGNPRVGSWYLDGTTL